MTSTHVSSSPPTAPARVEAKPHRWALSFWARAYRRLFRWVIVTRHAKRYCRPLAVHGAENFRKLRTPALVIANHTSHFDTAIALSLLPAWLYNRTAVVAAADRFYTSRLKGALYSLKYNAFPITRGGGRQALAYCESLLGQGWSLLIFPEGTRSKTGELLPFHPGPAILALGQTVPVLPIHIDGASNILPPKTWRSRPAAVRVRIGEPLTFPPGTTISEATRAMEEAVRALSMSSQAPPVRAAA